MKKNICVLVFIFMISSCGSNQKSNKQQVKSPIFIVLINETIAGVKKFPGNTETENAVIERLKKRGFSFIDPAYIKTGVEKNAQLFNTAASAGDAAVIRDILISEFKADYAIMGSTVTLANDQALKNYKTSLVSCTAMVNLKVVNIRTGLILATAGKSKAAIKLTAEDASREAIGRILDEMIGRADADGKFSEGPFLLQMKKSMSEKQ